MSTIKDLLLIVLSAAVVAFFGRSALKAYQDGGLSILFVAYALLCFIGFVFFAKVFFRDMPKKMSRPSVQCPCCGHITLTERGAFQICPVCFWEDDGQDDHNADLVLGGPNGDISLTTGRANYLDFGASRQQDLPHVRPPCLHETKGGT